MRSAWLPRSVLVRAAIRSGAGAVGFLLRFGVGSDAIVVALHADGSRGPVTRLLDRVALVRAGLRALVATGLVALFAWKWGGLVTVVAVGYAGAVAAATVLVERLAALRAARRGLSPLRGGLEAALACALVHAAALVNAALWPGGSGPDLGARLGQVAEWFSKPGSASGPGAVFYLACAAWLLAGPSGPAAVVERRRAEGAPPLALDDALLAPLHAWSVAFALWVAVPMAASMHGVGPAAVDKLVPGAAVALVTGVFCAMVGALGVLVLRGLDRLAERIG